jgi:hypothetical protein
MIFRTLNFKRRIVFTVCDHQRRHGFVMDGNIHTDSWLTSASMYRTLWSGTDLEGRTLPQWLGWLHRGWLTLIMWHASRSVLLGHDMWWLYNHATICTGYQVVVTMQIGLAGRVEWKRQQNDVFCVSAEHNFIWAATQYNSCICSVWVVLVWFPNYR